MKKESQNRDKATHKLWNQYNIITIFLTILFSLTAYLFFRKSSFEWNMVGILLVLFLMLVFFVITLWYGWRTINSGSYYIWELSKVVTGPTAKIIGLILILCSLIFIGFLVYVMIRLYYLIPLVLVNS